MFLTTGQRNLARDLAVIEAATPQSHGSPEAIARAFGAKLQREHPRDWPRLLGLAAQAAMEAEREGE